MALKREAPVYRTPEIARELKREGASPAYQAYALLRLGFTVLPIVMGADKFLGILTNDWAKYLWSGIPQVTGIAADSFMLAVGTIEILAGVLVALSARHFAWVVAAWLGLIIVNLLLAGQYFDIAMRDFGLMLGAIVLARLAQGVHEAKEH